MNNLIKLNIHFIILNLVIFFYLIIFLLLTNLTVNDKYDPIYAILCLLAMNLWLTKDMTKSRNDCLFYLFLTQTAILLTAEGRVANVSSANGWLVIS